MLLPRPLAIHLVGSWSRPLWLASPSVADALGPSAEFWRPDEEYLTEAQDDATRLAILDQLELGVDLLTDGEQRRQMFDRYFYARLAGVDAAHPVEHTWGGPRSRPLDESWRQVSPQMGSEGVRPRVLSPQVVDRIAWPGPLSVDDWRFLDAAAQGRRPTKMTMSGPVTALNRLVDNYYDNREQMAHDIARALNQEAHALADAGCRFIQFDEPEFRTAHLGNASFGRELMNETVAGLRERGVTVFSHMCYGYANAVMHKRVNPEFYAALELMASSDVDGVSIEYTQPGHDPDVLRALAPKGVIVGLINCEPTSPIETPNEVAGRLRDALTVVEPERLHVSTDCGVWFLPRGRAYRKLSALVMGTEIVRREL